MKSLRRCVQNPVQPEFSLCGDAEDGFESGDLEEDFVIAQAGESITCARCCLAVREIKAVRNPLRPRKQTDE